MPSLTSFHPLARLLPIRMFALELAGKTWKLALPRMQRKPPADFVPTPLIQPPPLLPSPVAISPSSPILPPPLLLHILRDFLAFFCLLSVFISIIRTPSLPLFLLSLILPPFPPQAAKVPRKEGEIRNVVARLSESLLVLSGKMPWWGVVCRRVGNTSVRLLIPYTPRE